MKTALTSLALLALVPTAATAGVPLPPSAELVAVDAHADDDFGNACAVDGDVAVVGAPRDDNPGGEEAGSLHAYVRTSTGWVQEAKVRPLDVDDLDHFGASTALESSTAVVGAPRHGNAEGAAYVYARVGTAWLLEQKLTASDAAIGDQLGGSVALAGATIAVGARFEDATPGANTGAAYVFALSGSGWTEEAKLTALAPTGELGAAIALDGDTLVAGAPGDDSIANDAGAVVVFERGGGVWMGSAKLVDASGVAQARLGTAVALDGDRLAAGAPQTAALLPGLVIVYARSGTTWVEEARLASPPGSRGDVREDFGAALALEGERLVVGAKRRDDGTGAVFVYERVAGKWTLRETLQSSATATGDAHGTTVALDGATLVTGAPGSGLALPDAGAAFVHELPTSSFCDAGDGSLASCPCGNAGLPDTGCDIQQQLGGVRMDVVEQLTTPQNRVTVTGSGFPTGNAPAALVIRGDGLDPLSPVVFGDGLRCVSAPLVRLGATFAAGGTSTHTFGHGTGAGPGTFYYQLWFRNTPAMYCTPDAFNLSNGRMLDW